jgi:hypothetical protein
MLPSFPSYVLLCDAPPLKEGGYGCHVLTRNWVQHFRDRVRLIITHRMSSNLDRDRIAADLDQPVLFYPDLSNIRFPRQLHWVKECFELLLFYLSLPRLRRAVRNSGANRIFAFFGANPWFLLVASSLRWITSLPLDLYLVDDLEDSTRLAGQSLFARLVRRWESKVLRSAARVFTFSPGYSEHLFAKYGVAATWLPVAIPAPEIVYQPFQPKAPDVRTLVFIGAVNPLYSAALRDILRTLDEWNSQSSPFALELMLLTYTDPTYIQNELGSSPHLRIRIKPGPDEFKQRMQQAWAIVLPYSFDLEVRTMVSTSFPTKLVDSFPSGRPLLVYGPPDASLPRYFQENHLQLVATSPSELKARLLQVEQVDNIDLIKSYQAICERFHSAASLASVLDPVSSPSIIAQTTF